MSDTDIDHLLAANRAWAMRVEAREPGFFAELARQQSPQYMWIGCSDSRVPANQIIDLRPGEVFVHRNVANVVVHTDLNCLSALQYAIDVVRVKHVLVVGHYGCAGVESALSNARLGLIDNWLRHVQDVRQTHAAIIDSTALDRRAERLCELNVIEQVAHVCQTTVVREAWGRGQVLAIHGWIYSLKDGLVRDLKMTTTRAEQLPEAHARAVAFVRAS